MEMIRMVQRRLLAAEAAAAAVIISLLVLSTGLASNGGNLSASMAPEVFFAKNSSYRRLGDAACRAFLRRSWHRACSAELHFKLVIHAPAKRFRLSVTDLDQLLRNGDYIGYQAAGFVCSFLREKGIKEDRLNPYNNQTEYCKALSKGSKNGGGSATVDEIPYFRSDEHRKTYEMLVYTPYSTPGLGFVFPNKTCPLVVVRLESRWSAQEEDCEASLVQAGRTAVDFTMPYTKTLLSHPCSSLDEPADNDSKPLIQWIFLKPLTKELWLATVCFVFFTGFVFWMIERSINPGFQGSSLAQFSTALYFVFSTLTFSHGQILRSPLSRIVLVVWCFAVLVLVQSYLATLSSMLAAEASTNNGSSSAGPVPLTLRSFSGLFVVTGCIFAFMLLISFTRWVYATYPRVRGSESQSADVDGGSVRPDEFSTPQNDAANGSVVPEQPVQEVRDNNSQGAHVSSAISRDEEAAGAVRDSMSNASEPAPDVYVQIEMTSTSNCAGGAL